jgi:eukaryotic-like serine/threonine-protein kinase
MKIPFTGYEPTPSEERLFLRAARFWFLFTLAAAGALFLALTVTSISQPVIVPRVTGLDQKDALKVLRSKGLKSKVMDRQWDEHLGEGAVLVQTPGPNAYLRRGDEVRVTLSRGTPLVKVPDLTGQSVRRAQVILTQARLRIGLKSILSTAGFPQDTVLAQVPEPGSARESSTAVNLLLSSGPEEPTYFMPYLRNRPLSDALRLFRPAGIIVEKIKTEVHDDLESGTILNQTPPSGSRLKAKSNVSLTVSAKSSDAVRKARWATVRFEMPLGPPKRLRIDVLDGSGTRTLYNAMEEGGRLVEVGVSVSGKATAQLYLNNEFINELDIE